MQFTCETQYTVKSLTVMAKVLRKTVKKKRSRITRAFAMIFAVLGILVMLLNIAMRVVDLSMLVLTASVLVLFGILFFEDRLTGWVAKKQMIPGSDQAVTLFTEEGFVTTAKAGRTEWNYDSITVVAETKEYFVFTFGKNHAQLHDKRHLKGGTEEEFRRFLEMMTGKRVQTMK